MYTYFVITYYFKIQGIQISRWKLYSLCFHLVIEFSHLLELWVITELAVPVHYLLKYMLPDDGRGIVLYRETMER